MPNRAVRPPQLSEEMLTYWLCKSGQGQCTKTDRDKNGRTTRYLSESLLFIGMPLHASGVHPV